MRIMSSHLNIGKLAFNGYIIDSHCHDSQADKTFENLYKTPELDQYVSKIKNELSAQPEKDTLKYVLVSSLACLKENVNQYYGNLKSRQELDRCQNKSVFKSIATCTPGEGSADEIEKLLTEKPGEYVGLKFHPHYTGLRTLLNPDSEIYKPYMELARKYKLPCVFHTAPGYSDPEHIYNLAQKFPEIPVVLYHMNLAPDGHWNEREKWNVKGIEIVEKAKANNNANLYLDTSWVSPKTVAEAIKRVGADRVLFGTDAPLGEFDQPEKAKPNFYSDNVNNIKSEIKTKFVDKSEEILDKVFYKNAEELFFTKNWAKNIQESAKSGNNLVTFGLFALSAVSAVGSYAYSKKQKTAE